MGTELHPSDVAVIGGLGGTKPTTSNRVRANYDHCGFDKVTGITESRFELSN
jgi:hypothetical protein